MPRHLIKRYTPDPVELKKHKVLRHLGVLLHDENLWHLNRRSVSGGVAAGLFWAMIPIPVQMVIAALSAILFRINLPISVALVWLTNPLTIPPVFYTNYLVGTWLLGEPADVGEFQMSVEWITAELGAIWKPLSSTCQRTSNMSPHACASSAFPSVSIPRKLWLSKSKIVVVIPSLPRNLKHCREPEILCRLRMIGSASFNRA